MRKFLRGFMDRYFHDEESIILTLLLVSALVLLLNIGGIIAPLIVAIILAYLLQGLVGTLQRFGCSYLLAVVLVYTLFIGAFLAFFLLVLPQAWSQFARLINELPRLLGEGQALLMLLPEHYPGVITELQIQDFIRGLRGEIALFGQTLLTYSIASIPNIMSWIIFLILVPVLVFFIMKDKSVLIQWMASMLPSHRPLMRKIWQEMDIQVANYVRGKALEIMILGSVSYIAFVFLGINYSLLLSVLMGLSVIVPFIGVTVVVFPVAAVAYAQWGIGSEFYTVLAVYAVIQLLDANLLVPLIFSETVNLHPVAIIVAVLVFGGLWGLAGVFFAIPLATLVKAIINAWPTHNPLTETVSPPKDAVVK